VLPRRLPFLPELRLRLAHSLYDEWESSARAGAPTPPPPYWCFPWVGGQALARHLLDHPELVRGKRVLDVGVGSGLVAIAAALAGAAEVSGTDVDPRALDAAARNARENAVALRLELADALDERRDADVVLAGDLFYERALAARVLPFLQRHPRSLAGDAGRNWFPHHAFAELARYDVPTSVEVEGRAVRAAAVYVVA
jgi:predicted nicotinamide N-methyase